MSQTLKFVENRSRITFRASLVFPVYCLFYNLIVVFHINRKLRLFHEVTDRDTKLNSLLTIFYSILCKTFEAQKFSCLTQNTAIGPLFFRGQKIGVSAFGFDSGNTFIIQRRYLLLP